MTISDLYPRVLFDDGTSGAVGAGGSPAPTQTNPPGGAGDGTAPQQIPSSITEDAAPSEGGAQFEGMEDDFDSIDLGLPPTDDGAGGRQAPQPAPPAQQPATAPTGTPQVAAQPAPQGGNASSAPRSQLDT